MNELEKKLAEEWIRRVRAGEPTFTKDDPNPYFRDYLAIMEDEDSSRGEISKTRAVQDRLP